MQAGVRCQIQSGLELPVGGGQSIRISDLQNPGKAAVTSISTTVLTKQGPIHE